VALAQRIQAPQADRRGTLAQEAATGLAAQMERLETAVVGFTAEALGLAMSGLFGRRLAIQTDHLLLLLRRIPVESVRCASCGAVVDPILLTQRTYNT